MTLASLLGADRRDGNVRIISNGRTNEILIYGPSAEMARIKDMIAKLDTPAPEGDAGGKLTVFSLRHVQPDQHLEKSLRLLFTAGGNFSLDPQRKSVMVYADTKTTDTVAALLERLEVLQAAGSKPDARTPAGDVQVRVVWLVGGSAKEEAPPLPDDLKEVLPGLAKLGIDRPRLAAQTLVNVTPGVQFQAKGVAKLDGPCQFSVTGHYGGQPDAAGLQITILATRLVTGVVEELCNLQTVITAPPGPPRGTRHDADGNPDVGVRGPGPRPGGEERPVVANRLPCGRDGPAHVEVFSGYWVPCGERSQQVGSGGTGVPPVRAGPARRRSHRREHSPR